jgi:WD40-like Beta Propeller Repeat
MKTIGHRYICVIPVILAVVGCAGDTGVIEPGSPRNDAELSRASDRYGPWSPPVNLGPMINSVLVDITPEISKDGLSLYFSSTRAGGFGMNDLWVSRRACTDMSNAKCAWGAPVNLGPTINNAGVDAAPLLSRDGHLLYFTSERPGGFGLNDVWVSRRANIHDDLAWETPVNLGPGVNTAVFEAGPSLRGPELYFSRGPTAAGPLDIYVSRREGNAFGRGTLVAELSSAGNELRPSIRFDGREMFVSSDRTDRPGSMGAQEIWVSTRKSNADAWSLPDNLGHSINTAFADQQPALSDDGTMLFFASNRPGGSGALDLYVTTRAKGGSE